MFSYTQDKFFQNREALEKWYLRFKENMYSESCYVEAVGPAYWNKEGILVPDTNKENKIGTWD